MRTENECYSQRFCRYFTPGFFDHLTMDRSRWHETPERVRMELRRGAWNRARLEWVRTQMALRLTSRERECVELCYFRGLNFVQAGALTGTHRSSVFRAVERALRKLRQAAIEEGML
jgi:DNA-directed RNA polymerase specialized sigma24 family protein